MKNGDSLNKDGDLTIQIIQNGDFAMKKHRISHDFTVDRGGRMGISCGFLVPVAASRCSRLAARDG
jgi:hypothetical protein